MPDQKPSAPSAAVVVSATPLVAPGHKKTFEDWLTAVNFKEQLQVALPKHLNPDHFVRMVLTQTMKTPDLLKCTQESLFKCILDAAAAGLEIDGRRAHLIPFKNNQKRIVEATLIYDYKGLVELCFRSGLVSNVHADVVCENDVFDYDTGKIVQHKIDFRKPRGDVYAVYCLIRLKDGTEKAEVLGKAEVDAVRRRSKASGAGPWVTDYNEMAKKTAARRCLKWIPLSAEIREQIEKEEDFIDLVEKDGIQTVKTGLSAAVDGDPDKREPEGPPGDPAGEQGPQGQPGEPSRRNTRPMNALA